MIVDANKIENSTVIQCDICIIGAGAAGITLARELDGSELNVWLLESGGFDFERETQDLYKGTTSGHPYFELDETRLRYLGGTTNHWSGMCRPLDEIDFEARDWIPGSGWPFDRNHLLPWYRRAQVVCELGEFTYDASRWLPENQHVLPFTEGTFTSSVYQRSVPTRFGRTYRSQLKKSRNVTLCLHANVTHLQANQSGKQLQSLHIATLENNRLRIEPRTCILAGGSIENARLLLASNDANANGLGNENDLVGRYFMDHLVLSRNGALMTTTGLVPQSYYIPYYRHRGRSVNLTVLLAKAAQRQQQTANYSAMFFPVLLSEGVKSYRRLTRKFKNNKEVDDWWHHIGNMLGDFDEVASKFYYDHLTTKPAPLQLEFYNQWEQAPDPDNRVSLGSDKDALGMQRANIAWRLGEIDRRTLLKAHEVMALEAGRTGIGRVRPGIMENDPLPASVRGDNHQMGTTRMHTDPALGVVDANCRLHTVANVYIAGGSVFPTCGSTNPTLTVVALALRLADHIKGTKTW